MTYQIIYSSQAASPMQIEELEEILASARKNNTEKKVTGALVYVEGVFLQVLEGEQATVRTLMSHIATDVRHTAVTVLQEGEVPLPTFGDWKMAYLSATPEQISIWAGLGGTTDVTEILEDIRREPQRASQMAGNILASLGL